MSIKVLVVIDADFRFDGLPPTPDFTFTTLVGALVGAGFQVTKAHRGTDPTADLQNFTFNGAGVNLLAFDAVWLIGREGRNSVDSTGTSPTLLPDAEVVAIASYMAAGGGVFATGDHDSIGAVMCGKIPRVRAMRAWFGINDAASPMAVTFPRNFPSLHADRADTTQRSTHSNYNGDATIVYFENQSDSTPQTITPVTSPAHPILRKDNANITIYPDHMHEGTTFGDLGANYDYTQTLTFATTPFSEFPQVAGHRELPQVIATSTTNGLASKFALTDQFVGMATEASQPQQVHTLSVYDGRQSGVGRIVTGSTFHHYIDINLTGDSSLTSPPAPAAALMRAGSDAAKGHGYLDPLAGDRLATIKQVYVNITEWIARPAPSIALILERSTFSKDEVTAQAEYGGAILVTVDGLKPSQFPNGGISTLMPSAAQLLSWAPNVVPADPTGFTITPTGVTSDDPGLSDRLQRFTFKYKVTLDATAFGAAVKTVAIDASLTSPVAGGPITDRAWVNLVPGANPFQLDLDYPGAVSWLSSDLRVFPVVADGGTHLGQLMPDNANRIQALQYLQGVISHMTIPQFEALTPTEPDSALSPLPTTTSSHKPVYNFAIARVRLNHAMAQTQDIRVFFRIVPSPTTAALTYSESGGTPTGSYQQTPGATPIALPGTDSAGMQWVSFPCFASGRQFPVESQLDMPNVKPMPATNSEISAFFGALIDNNLDDTYLPLTPGGTGSSSLRDLMMSEHQCLVAQIVYAGAPIPNGAQPATSDKLAQRNLSFSEIANPGLEASRAALQTFEIDATADAIAGTGQPDELLLEWRNSPPEGTEVQIHIPEWSATAVIALADQRYLRHELRKTDDHTIAVPGGGIRYVPLPSAARRQTGVLAVYFPLGVKRGQRFDLSIRQVRTRFRRMRVPITSRNVTAAEAKELLARLAPEAARSMGLESATSAALPRGVYTLPDKRTLITDLRVLDASGDHAILIDPTPAAVLAAAQQQSGRWRETIGAFQLAVPVSTKAQMLPYQLRLLSMLRWRAALLRPSNRWYATFRRYVELHADKVQALGGNPWTVPATPNGHIPPGAGLPGGGSGDDLADAVSTIIRYLRRPTGCGMFLLVLLIVVLLLWWILHH
jgi:hypothetical protein